MAGMLPGVECARRRRFHQGGGWNESHCSSSNGRRTRRSAFCLYTSNHETHVSAISSLLRKTPNQSFHDEKLGGVAREAKERLDEKLRSQRKPETKRQICKESERGSGSGVLGDLPKEVFGIFGSKKSSSFDSKIFSWAKLGGRASDQDECAVCLEQFKAGETLLHLSCAHRFHSRCLVPWLESSSHCPCCRLRILI
ncbi:hypothetical protein NE237_024651 [Protea cynaroides]|uniref:RING-type domain-containing protein n=1 Tax=Protea cynaroides TaxID=273540 RepID=A0A9Q0H1J5_9MAGN|nr:hypothetical protein NE237_024651 [Protea cynaroides]